MYVSLGPWATFLRCVLFVATAMIGRVRLGRRCAARTSTKRKSRRCSPSTTSRFLTRRTSASRCASRRGIPTNPVVARGPAGSVDALGVQFYGSVLRENGKYRLWYVAVDDDVENKMPYSRWRAAYAESDDGVHWTKPNLGLVEFRGNKDNNLILTDPAPLGFVNLKVLADPDDPDPAAALQDFDARVLPASNAARHVGAVCQRRRPAVEALGSAELERRADAEERFRAAGDSLRTERRALQVGRAVLRLRPERLERDATVSRARHAHVSLARLRALVAHQLHRLRSRAAAQSARARPQLRRRTNARRDQRLESEEPAARHRRHLARRAGVERYQHRPRLRRQQRRRALPRAGPRVDRFWSAGTTALGIKGDCCKGKALKTSATRRSCTTDRGTRGLEEAGSARRRRHCDVAARSVRRTGRRDQRQRTGRLSTARDHERVHHGGDSDEGRGATIVLPQRRRPRRRRDLADRTARRPRTPARRLFGEDAAIVAQSGFQTPIAWNGKTEVRDLPERVRVHAVFEGKKNTEIRFSAIICATQRFSGRTVGKTIIERTAHENLERKHSSSRSPFRCSLRRDCPQTSRRTCPTRWWEFGAAFRPSRTASRRSPIGNSSRRKTARLPCGPTECSQVRPWRIQARHEAADITNTGSPNCR